MIVSASGTSFQLIQFSLCYHNSGITLTFLTLLKHFLSMTYICIVFFISILIVLNKNKQMSITWLTQMSNSKLVNDYSRTVSLSALQVTWPLTAVSVWSCTYFSLLFVYCWRSDQIIWPITWKIQRFYGLFPATVFSIGTETLHLTYNLFRPT